MCALSMTPTHIDTVLLANPIQYKFAQPRHSNKAAMKTNGTVATVLASKIWGVNCVSIQALIDVVMARSYWRKVEKLTPLTLYVKL